VDCVEHEFSNEIRTAAPLQLCVIYARKQGLRHLSFSLSSFRKVFNNENLSFLSILII
jgi:hypothetical protein